MSKRAAFGACLARETGERRDAPFPPSETGGNGARGARRLRQTGGERGGARMARGLARRAWMPRR